MLTSSLTILWPCRMPNIGADQCHFAVRFTRLQGHRVLILSKNSLAHSQLCTCFYTEFLDTFCQSHGHSRHVYSKRAFILQAIGTLWMRHGEGGREGQHERMVHIIRFFIRLTSLA
jgi:hypothetical protein